MKRFAKSMLGVTLLEVMLVLAVAAMIIVMSVRYYQQATASQQVNSVLEEIQAITAAADGIAQGTNSYSTVTSTTLAPLMPNGSLMAPWGGKITITSPGPTSYGVSIANMPVNVCNALIPKLASNASYGNVKNNSCANTTTPFTYTYTP